MLVNLVIYGKDGKFPKDKIGKHLFAQWAIDAKHLLKSYQQLAKEKLLPQDAITPISDEHPLAEPARLETVPRDYPTASVATATSDTGVCQRIAWHEA